MPPRDRRSPEDPDEHPGTRPGRMDHATRFRREGLMKNLDRFLGKKEFHVFLFCLGVVFLNWPFLNIFQSGGIRRTFVALFALWGIAVALLHRIGTRCGGKAPDHEGKPSDD